MVYHQVPTGAFKPVAMQSPGYNQWVRKTLSDPLIAASLRFLLVVIVNSTLSPVTANYV